MEIYFIRHTSVDVTPGYCYGNTDVETKSSFAEEAECVKGKLSDLKFDQVYTSPLSRAVKLAAYCGYGDAVHDARLKELNFGEWEMKNYDELYANDERFKSWSNNYLTERCPEGESFSDLFSRVEDFINETKKQGYERIAAFCHGGILASAMLIAGIVDKDNLFSNIPPYGSVIKIEI